MYESQAKHISSVFGITEGKANTWFFHEVFNRHLTPLGGEKNKY